jgi:hypothetical protein
MTLPFIDREPTPVEFERLRLLLSTFQDGTGSLPGETGTLPGGFQFEVSLAMALGGRPTFKKGKFDVVLSSPDSDATQYGLSCKMKEDLRGLPTRKRVYIEESNSPAKTWEHLHKFDISKETLETRAFDAGRILLDRFKALHRDASHDPVFGSIDTSKSSLVFLSYDRRDRNYQIYWFPLTCVQTRDLVRCEVQTEKNGKQTDLRSLRGYDADGMLFEWYHSSGGQFKLYPPVSKATWHSPIFQLEPLPTGIQTGLAARASQYFQQKWQAANPSQPADSMKMVSP